ncbi:MAG: Gfo/Idh/MocA family oxidoreductase [Alphaproteobacteria bacterium]
MRSPRPGRKAAVDGHPAGNRPSRGDGLPRLALLGCGGWGVNIARTLAEAGLLSAVCDTDPGAAATVAQRHGVRGFTDPEEVLAADCDGVVVATPAPTHGALARRALAAGKHVLVEKPFALDLADAEATVDLARRKGLVVMAGHLLRYHPAFEAAAAIVRSGGVGRILRIESRRAGWGKVRSAESALWSLAPHDVSMILHLLEGRPRLLSASASAVLQPGIADDAGLTLGFPCGAVATVSVSWLAPQRVQSLSVVGTSGALVFDDIAEWERKLTLFPDALRHDGDGWSALRREPVHPPVVPGQPLARELAHFAHCIATGAEPATGGDEGMRVTGIIEAAHAAAAPAARHAPRRAADGGGIHPTAVVDDGATIGPGTRIWHFTHVSAGSRIGRNCVLGQNVMVGPDVAIGDGCKLQNNVSVYAGVTLEADVFCGPSCVFTNVRTPRAHVSRRSEFQPTRVGRGATIGANATVVCGTTIGRYAMVGAGAVVTRDVAPYALVVGNPARRVGWVGSAGERLGPELVCPRTGERFRQVAGGIEREGGSDGVQ